MGGFLGTKETLTRERVKEMFRDKTYSYFEQKVTLLEVRDDSLLLKISFLMEYKNRMIAIEEKEPIVVPFSDFRIEDWGRRREQNRRHPIAGFRVGTRRLIRITASAKRVPRSLRFCFLGQARAEKPLARADQLLHRTAALPPIRSFGMTVGW